MGGEEDGKKDCQASHRLSKSLLGWIPNLIFRRLESLWFLVVDQRVGLMLVASLLAVTNNTDRFDIFFFFYSHIRGWNEWTNGWNFIRFHTRQSPRQIWLAASVKRQRRISVPCHTR